LSHIVKSSHIIHPIIARFYHLEKLLAVEQLARPLRHRDGRDPRLPRLPLRRLDPPAATAADDDDASEAQHPPVSFGTLAPRESLRGGRDVVCKQVADVEASWIIE
jgi:hypothetical protein